MIFGKQYTSCGAQGLFLVTLVIFSYSIIFYESTTGTAAVAKSVAGWLFMYSLIHVLAHSRARTAPLPRGDYAHAPQERPHPGAGAA